MRSFRITQLPSGLVRVVLAFTVALQGSCATHPSPIGTPTPSGPSVSQGLSESFKSGRETVAVSWAPAFDPAYIRIPSPEPKGAEGAGNAVSDLWSGCGPVGLQIFFAPYLIGIIPGALILAGCTVATPVVAIDGAVRGSAKRKEIQQADAPIRSVLREMVNDDALVESVLLTARDQTPHTLSRSRLTDRDKVPCSKGLVGNFWGPSYRSFCYNYDTVARDGIDTVLNLEVAPVFTLGEGVDPPVSLRVEARARLISARDGAEFYNETFVFCCESHTRAGWAGDNWDTLRAFFTNAYFSLGERIAKQVFVSNATDEGRGAEQSLALGLRLKHPPLKEGLGSFEVSSAQPTLEWESLSKLSPPEGASRCTVTVAGHCDLGQLAENQEAELRPVLERNRDVTYELRVAGVGQVQAPKLVYARAGLTTPSHTLEVPLQTGAEYIWSVRAHFELDGRWRVTAWGYQKLRRGRDQMDSSDASGANKASPHPPQRDIPPPGEDVVNCVSGGERKWVPSSKCD